MKKRRKQLFFMVFIFLLVSGCSFIADYTEKAKTPDPFVVGYANMSDEDVFCARIKNHFMEISQNNPHIKVEFADGKFDRELQSQQVRKFIEEKVQVIIINPADYEGLVPVAKAATEAGIPVIALNIKLAGGETIFVGSKNYDSGKLQGEYMAEKLPKNAKIFYLKGTAGLYHSVERIQGFVDACLAKRPDIEILASGDAGYVRNKARELTLSWLALYPQVDGIVAANDQMAFGAIDALKLTGRQAGVIVGGIDATEEACKLIKSGELSQSVYQDGFGQAEKAYEVVQMMQRGEKIPKEIILPFVSVTVDNVDDFLP
jgi:inositol transport system substrate-binding protein